MAGSRPKDEVEAQQQEGPADESGAKLEQGDFLADSRSAVSERGPALVEQPEGAYPEFTPEQRVRIEKLRDAARQVVDAFDSLSPWGSAGRAIEVRLDRALSVEEGQRLQPLPAKDRRP